ncbi:MAG: FKBP-type peptidyl-prolyl cis-trans isomerase [Bacteroidia bacterium]|jgi:FKBP-type peptidyl-prolyl cis-trans isomerase|nr:FKBP-type peptidyl-prolyl cis-trans isomerase [Bacteroidia bacterium]
MIIRLFVFTLLLLIFVSCNSVQDKNQNRPKPGKKEIVDLNKYLVQKDRERIENYVERKNLKMTESPTGLWYLIKSEGEGSYFTDNDKVIMEYECSLLDGTCCYSSKELGPKEIVLEKNEMGAGLNQGLKMLKPGGEAIFIIPPFLAYGFVGDGNKIPSRAVIVYNVTIKKER